MNAFLKTQTKRISSPTRKALLIPAVFFSLLSGAAQAEEDVFLRSGNDEFFSAELAVPDSELAVERGQAGTLISGETLGVAILTGVSAGNSVVGGNTGDNFISRDAFDDARGVAFVVQNSGNNAVVNAAMVINLNIQN